MRPSPRPARPARPARSTRPARRPGPGRLRGLLALGCSVLLVGGGGPTASAAVLPTSAGYVALGDSFAAGVGSRSYRPDDPCYRSPASYPAVVAQRYRLELTLAACSGAVTADVVEAQARSLRTSTRYVTVTIGGNDLGFSSVLTTCALPGWLGRCGPAVDRSLATLRTSLPGRLDRVLATVRQRAPQATVVVTGYPRLFGDEDCSALTFFSADERSRLNAATAELDDVIADRTAAAGLRYADPAPAFGRHAWCDDPSWVNGPSRPLLNAYHPNADGHAGYAALVGPSLAGGQPDPAAVTAGAPDLLGATPDAAVQLPPAAGRSGARSGATDASTFALPDLDTAAVTRASLAAGLTRAELARFRRAQRTGAGDAELDRLDATLTARAAQRRTATGSR